MDTEAERHPGDGSTENQEAMKRAGAAKLITKEAAVEELYAAIQEIARHKSSRSPARQ